MFIILHGRYWWKLIISKRLIGQSVEKEYFLARTKNKDIELKIIKERINFNTDDSFDG